MSFTIGDHQDAKIFHPWNLDLEIGLVQRGGFRVDGKGLRGCIHIFKRYECTPSDEVGLLRPCYLNNHIYGKEYFQSLGPGSPCESLSAHLSEAVCTNAILVLQQLVFGKVLPSEC